MSIPYATDIRAAGDDRTHGIGRPSRTSSEHRRVDIYTQECLAIESEQRLKGEDAVMVLNRIKTHRGAPKMLYCDNGSEFMRFSLT